MLTFVARAFEGVFLAFLWLNLIGCAIAGTLIGKEFGVGWAFLGFILGVWLGIMTDIFSGGLVVIFVNMSKDLSEVKKYIEEMSSGNIVNNGAGTAPAMSASVVDRYSAYDNVALGDDVPLSSCKNCGKQVDSSSSQVSIYKVCNHCGARL